MSRELRRIPRQMVARMEGSGQDPQSDPWLGRVRRVIAPLCESCVISTEVGGGGVALLSSAGVRAVIHTTDDVSQALEALQLDLGEGPCIDAGSSATPVLVEDVQDPGEGVANRWPFFLPRVDELGVRAVFAFPLQLGSIRLGTLELYRAEPGRLTADQLSTAFRTADDMESAIVDIGQPGEVDRQGWDLDEIDGGARGQAPGIASVPQGLGRTASTVHQAAGMVMVQLDGTIDEAMAVLRASAFADGLSMIDLCRGVVHRQRRFSKEQT